MSLTMRAGLVVIGVAIIFVCVEVDGVPDTTYLYHACRGPLVDPLNPYVTALDEVIRRLRDHTPRRRGYHHTVTVIEQGRGCKGYADCNRIISTNDCDRCLQAADGDMLHICGFSLTAETSLTDCYISYVNTTVV